MDDVKEYVHYMTISESVHGILMDNAWTLGQE